jgi:hypothetical protein
MRPVGASGVVMSPNEERENLENLVAMLSDKSGPEKDWQAKSHAHRDVVKLRRLVHAWKKAGRDYRKAKFNPKDKTDLEQFVKGIQFFLDRDGNLRLVDCYTTNAPYDPAAIQFTRLLRNSQRARLDGPCPNCGNWFAKKTLRKSIFCSRKCAGTATKAAERERKRNKKLERARQALRNYRTRPARFANLAWQEWVTQAEPTISKKFLTTAANSGDLKPPKKGRK